MNLAAFFFKSFIFESVVYHAFDLIGKNGWKCFLLSKSGNYKPGIIVRK
jgi:hypothetical protein